MDQPKAYARPVVISAAPGIPLLGPSGASAHLRGIAAALAAPVVTPRWVDHRGLGGHSTLPAVVTGVAGWPSWLPKYRDMAEVNTARRCAEAAAALNPDLVYERHALFSDAGWRASTATGARWILEVNAPLVAERSTSGELRDPPFAARWERDVLLAAPEIVAVSAWLVEWLHDLGCKRVRHVPNGVEGWVGDRQSTRARLALDGKFVLGFLGSMKPWHGVERLVPLLEAMPEAILLLVGTGPVQIQHPRAISLGQVDEQSVAHLVAAMDVGLAPYTANSPPWFCPLKLLAYRAQGTPIVATDTGDCAHLTGNAGTMVAPQASALALAEACASWQEKPRPTPMIRTWSTVAAEALVPATAPDRVS
jgi:glycosyltransferase involved in cell wall biosynthesis